MKRKEITMSISQFKAYSNKEITLKEIERVNKGISKMDRISYKILVVALAGVFVFINSRPSFANGLGAVDDIGEKLLGIAQQVCYWICLIMGIKEIITELLKGDALHNPSDIMRAIIKYSIAFASVYFMPYLFDMIKEMF